MIASIWEFVNSWFTPTTLFLFLNLMIGTIIIMSRYGAHTISQQLHQHQDQLGHYDSLSPLVRPPSLLERIKSIFSFYKFKPPAQETEHLRPTEPAYEPQYYPKPDNPHQLGNQPSLLDRLKSNKFSSYKFEQPKLETEHLQSSEPQFETHNPSSLEANLETETESNPNVDPSPNNSHLVKRSKSDSHSGVSKNSQQERIRKSVSQKLKARNLEENDEIVELVVPPPTMVDRKNSLENSGNETVSSGEDEGVDAKADDFINRFNNQLRLQRLNSLKRFGKIFKGK